MSNIGLDVLGLKSMDIYITQKRKKQEKFQFFQVSKIF